MRSKFVQKDCTEKDKAENKNMGYDKVFCVTRRRNELLQNTGIFCKSVFTSKKLQKVFAAGYMVMPSKMARRDGIKVATRWHYVIEGRFLYTGNENYFILSFFLFIRNRATFC